MRIRPTLSALALLALVSAAGACGSSTPDANDPICGGSGSQSYTDMCATIQNALTAKCPGTTFDCTGFVSGTACSDTTKVFCVDTTNSNSAAITAAASCADVATVKLAAKCHS
jgi:hypothetical protein